MGKNRAVVLASLLLALPPVALTAEAFNRITVFNAVRDAAEARHSCGVNPAKIAQAIDAFRVILDLYPDAGYCAYSWNEIGELYLLLKDWPHAVSAFKRILERYPRSDYSDDALKRLLQHARQAGDWGEAAEAIERFVSERPSHPSCDDLLLQLAQIYERQQGNLPKAAEALQRLINSYPGSELAPQALYRLASLYQRARNFRAAIEAYDRLVNLYPFSDLADDAALASAKCAEQAGSPYEALARLQAFVRLFPGSNKLEQARREAVRLLGRGYWTGRYGRGRALFWIRSIGFPAGKQGLQGAPGTAEALFKRAQALRAQRALAEAISLYTRIAAEYRGSDLCDNAQMAVGECYEELSLLAKQARLAATPERQAEVMGSLKRALGKEGTLESVSPKEFLKKAIEAYRSVAYHFPGSNLCDDALYRAIKCYHELHDRRGEIETAFDLASKFPWSEYVEKLGRSLERAIEKGEWPFNSAEGLARAFEPIAKLGPGSDLYDEAVFFAACGRLGMGDFNGARRLLRQLLGTWDDSPHLAYAQFLLGRSFEIQGDLAGAAREYEALLRRFPNSGLADDAERGLKGDLPNLGLLSPRPDFAEAVGRAGRCGADIVQRGEVVLVCPFYHSPLLRAYNFPELLAEGWRELRRVTGASPEEPVVVAVAPDASSSQPGGPILLPLEVCTEPPKFEEAFSSMAELIASDDSLSLFREAIPSFPEAFGQFAGVLLRFNLVHETRDVIGGAQAAVVPFDSVREVHDKAYQALAKFIASDGDVGLLTPEAACGLLFGLVEAAGGYRENAINWGPLPKIFALARAVPKEFYEGRPERALAALAWCLERAMGKGRAALLAKFGLKVDRRLLNQIRAEMAAKP